MENLSFNNIFCGIDVSNLQMVGQGRQGKVYLLPPNKVIKVFNHSSSCKNQYITLKHSEKSRFFPKVYEFDKYSIIMDFVPGTTMSYYISTNGLSKTLSIELVRLFEEFKALQFTRLDIRIGHIFVQHDESVKIIDPRSSFKIIQDCPLLMMKGLKQSGVLEKFFNNIKDTYPNYYEEWSKAIS